MRRSDRTFRSLRRRRRSSRRRGVILPIVLVIFILLAMTLCFGMVAADDPMAIPTFHCLGVYWNPADGSADKVCQVKYRIEGSDDWREALPLWFDEHGQTLVVKHGQNRIAVLQVFVLKQRVGWKGTLNIVPIGLQGLYGWRDGVNFFMSQVS